jgi:DNA-binding beta-propeller fold protein YncE
MSGTSVLKDIYIGHGDFYSDPASMIYDPANHDIYVANGFSDAIAVISGDSLVANIPTVSSMDFLSYVPSNGDVYATNGGGDCNGQTSTVSVLSGTQITGTVNVSVGSGLIAYDAANNDTYVASGCNDNVDDLALINSANQVASTISVCTVNNTPSSMVYNPSNEYMYVACGNPTADGTLDILSGTTVIANLTIGNDAHYLTYDPSNNDVFIANENTGLGGATNVDATLMVVHGTSIVANVTLAGSIRGIQGIAYDSANQEVYVASHSASALFVFQGTTLASTIKMNDPLSIAFDSASNALYIACSQASYPTHIVVLNGS